MKGLITKLNEIDIDNISNDDLELLLPSFGMNDEMISLDESIE